MIDSYKLRKDFPMLFDRNHRAKPAYYAVTDFAKDDETVNDNGKKYGNEQN